MSGTNDEKRVTFWDHLDEMRGYILKAIIVVITFGIVAFLFKEQLFDIILAPKRWDFVTFRLFNEINSWVAPADVTSNIFNVKLINTGLADQFMIHMKMAIFVGALCASPYILYLLFSFISPALYEKERRYAFRVTTSGYLMFITGVALAYFLIFPLTFRFLGTYQVSDAVENTITLQSYINTLMMLCLVMGIVFEIPVLSWIMAKLGLINSSVMVKFRRHAIVAVLIISAIITPTSDIFTLMLVAMPIWLLYEASILIVKITKAQNDKE